MAGHRPLGLVLRVRSTGALATAVAVAPVLVDLRPGRRDAPAGIEAGAQRGARGRRSSGGGGGVVRGARSDTSGERLTSLSGRETDPHRAQPAVIPSVHDRRHPRRARDPQPSPAGSRRAAAGAGVPQQHRFQASPRRARDPTGARRLVGVADLDDRNLAALDIAHHGRTRSSTTSSIHRQGSVPAPLRPWWSMAARLQQLEDSLEGTARAFIEEIDQLRRLHGSV